jgi:hypothetical protein
MDATRNASLFSDEEEKGVKYGITRTFPTEKCFAPAGE